MNELIKKENLFENLKNYFKKNYKLIIVFFVLIIVFFISYQFYIFNKNKNILQDSLDYYQNKSLNTNDELILTFEKLSKEKNFYSILSSLELIKIDFKNKKYIGAYKKYIKLLNKNTINNTYKSAIAIQASYKFLEILVEEDINKKETLEIIDKLISYIDTSLESYVGLVLEIKFLLIIFQLDNSFDQNLIDNLKNIYEQIQNTKSISSSLKERVKILYEFQKYK